MDNLALTPGLAFVLCTLVGLVTVFMETVLVGLRMAGLACLGILALRMAARSTTAREVVAAGGGAHWATAGRGAADGGIAAESKEVVTARLSHWGR